jgi:hypothetical protein
MVSMCRMMTIAALGLAAVLAVPPAGAQNSGGDGGYEQPAGLPPSAAVKRAVAANPGAKPLGVTLRGGIYVVRLRVDGSIIQVGVDPATGDVFPLD